MVEGYGMSGLLPLEVCLVPGVQFLVERLETSWVGRLQGILLAIVEIESQPFVIVRPLVRGYAFLGQQVIVPASQIGRYRQHVRVTDYSLSSDFGVIYR